MQTYVVCESNQFYQLLLIQNSFDNQGPIQNYPIKTNISNRLYFYVLLEIYEHLLINQYRNVYQEKDIELSWSGNQYRWDCFCYCCLVTPKGCSSNSSRLQHHHQQISALELAAVAANPSISYDFIRPGFHSVRYDSMDCTCVHRILCTLYDSIEFHRFHRIHKNSVDFMRFI